jgi:NhaA family Na+:H+ antiporter
VTHRVALDQPRLADRGHLLDTFRQETVGGALLLGAAVLALVWANSPWRDTYRDLAAVVVGPEALDLHLSLAAWAADGLLAVVFFVAGLELKHEFVLGSLSERSQAVLPVVAAACGMAVPAALFVATVTALGDADTVRGWGVPMATDIAFALAVLAVVGSHLPVALRAFLLTLAVVDDLGAIAVIAVFYAHGFAPVPLLAAAVLAGAYALLQRWRVRAWWIYVPIAAAVWTLVHASGIHATVAGVALGLLTRVRCDPGEDRSPADRIEHRLRPWSAAVCVPAFAFFAAGVTVVDGDAGTFRSAVYVAVVVGLVLGKPIGVYGGARLVARFTRAELNPSLRWSDVFAVGLLAGIGFTVSLLISELAFDASPDRLVDAKAGVLSASVAAAALATVALRRRSRAYRLLRAAEEADDDHDGAPDGYRPDAPAGGSGGPDRAQRPGGLD